MAQSRAEYGKVAAPRPFSGAELFSGKLDGFRFVMICMILLTIVSVFHVWSRFRIVELNLQLSDASRQIREAEQEQKRLKLEAASLRNPGRVETIAKQELGMALPTEQQIILVK